MKTASFESQGDEFQKQKEYLKAIEQYNKGVESDPKNSRLICKIGSSLLNLKEYDEAIKLFVSQNHFLIYSLFFDII